MNPASRALSRWRRIARPLPVLALVGTASLLALRVLLFSGPFQKVTPLPGAPIVDLHCHAAGIGAGNSGCFVSPALRSNFRFHAYLKAFGTTEQELSTHGDSILLDRLSENLARSRHVRAAVVLAMDGVVDPQGRLDTRRTEVYVPNEFVADATQRHTNLLFGASINPHRLDALERVDDCARRHAVLVKWIPSTMDIDPADPRLIPFYQRLRQHGLILLSHTGSEHSFTSSRDELSDPWRLRLPLEQGVIVVAAHTAPGARLSRGGASEELRRLMREFPNLYADISALTLLNRQGALEAALGAEEFRGRLVYGTDYPLINTPLVSSWYFPLHLTLRQSREIGSLTSPWDRDVELKHALGVPTDVFERTAGLIEKARNR